MRIGCKTLIVSVALTMSVPLVATGQGFERISLGGKAAVWSVPDLDNFTLVLDGASGTEVYNIDESVLFGIRPFVRLGLTRHLALELSHEFDFGDTNMMVSSGTGIWRPFDQHGLELHVSICYGQIDWDGPGDFDSPWGWEVGAAYRLKLSDSVDLITGIAYRDLSFEFEEEDLFTELEETRPDVVAVGISGDSADAAGFVADVGIQVIF